ncbi:MAG: ZIP family metal transporter [Candidatus Saccharimonas sp.]
MEYMTLLFWSLAGSVVSLVGGVALLRFSHRRQQVIRYALPFGAGTLLAVAFLSLLPEALHGVGEMVTAYCMLAGFLVFFILERALGWFHHHETHHHDTIHGAKNTTHQWLVIIGDTLHNAIDGVAIGAAFLVNPAAGIGTAIAVSAHEIPQEIGDFGILLGKGMAPRRVIIVNALSALATVVTALVTYALGSSMALNPAPLLAVAAGMFVYIAASDIIPDIHERPRREGNKQALVLLAGVAVMALVTAAMPHDHEDHAEHAKVDNTSHAQYTYK